MYCLRRCVPNETVAGVHLLLNMLTVLCSYLPLLLLPLPLSLSPIHLILLLTLTYVLNRPCVYCSGLLVILFASSCHWSNRCFIDISQHGEETSSIASWFIPRLYTTAGSMEVASPKNDTSGMGGFLVDVTRSTVSGIAHAVKDSASEFMDEARQRITAGTTQPSQMATADAGIGTHWLRHLFGRSEWTLPCVGVKVVL